MSNKETRTKNYKIAQSRAKREALDERALREFENIRSEYLHPSSNNNSHNLNGGNATSTIDSTAIDDPVDSLRRSAKQQLDHYYETHTPLSETAPSPKRHLDLPKANPSDAISPILASLEPQIVTKVELHGNKLGVFRHPDAVAGQRSGRFLESVVNQSIILRSALQEMIYSNDGYLRRALETLHGDVDRVDAMLLLHSARTHESIYSEEDSKKFAGYSELVNFLKGICELTPEAKSKTRNGQKPYYLEKHAYLYNPNPNINNESWNPIHYTFDKPALIDFDVYSKEAENSPRNSDGSITYYEKMLRFRFKPLPYARYRTRFAKVRKFDDVLPNEVQEILQGESRVLRNFENFQEMVDEARETALFPGLDVTLFNVRTTHGMNGKEREFRKIAELNGEVAETESEDGIREQLIFQVEGFRQKKSRTTFGRRSNPARKTISEIRPPLQKVVEDFRGLLI